MTTVPAADAQARLDELLDEACIGHERVTITRDGRPTAVLISVDELAELDETVFWQAEPGALYDVARDRALPASELLDEQTVRVYRISGRADAYR